MAAKRREELLNLIPAYAIDALDENERAEFEAWLQHDPEAQAILADYRMVANHLVALAPLRPAPKHLQADLRQRLAAGSSGNGAVKSVAPKPEPIQKPSRRRSVWFLAAAALITMVILAVVLLQLGPTDDSVQIASAKELYYELKRQSGSSQYTLIPSEMNEAVYGNMVVSLDGEYAVLCIWDLPPTAPDQIYQMWLIDDSGTRASGGLFQPDPSQKAVYLRVPFDQPAAAYRSVGVSIEPAGGSPLVDRPTGPRVLSVPLS